MAAAASQARGWHARGNTSTLNYSMLKIQTTLSRKRNNRFHIKFSKIIVSCLFISGKKIVSECYQICRNTAIVGDSMNFMNVG